MATQTPTVRYVPLRQKNHAITSFSEGLTPSKQSFTIDLLHEFRDFLHEVVSLTKFLLTNSHSACDPHLDCLTFLSQPHFQILSKNSLDEVVVATTTAHNFITVNNDVIYGLANFRRHGADQLIIRNIQMHKIDHFPHLRRDSAAQLIRSKL